MSTRRQERVATGLAGAGIVGAGSHLRGMGVDQADHLAGKPAPSIGPLKQKAWQLGRLGKKPGRGRARALYAGGTLLATAGTVPLGAALTNHLPARERVGKAIKIVGLEGQPPQYKPASPGRRAMGAALGGSGLGSYLPPNVASASERAEVERQLKTFKTSAGKTRKTTKGEVNWALERDMPRKISPWAKRAYRVTKRDAQTFVGAGYQGTRDSLKTKAHQTRQTPASPKAWLAATGVTAGAGAAGTGLAHLAFDVHDKARALKGMHGSRLRSAATGIAGATALTGSLPVANRVLHHVSPEYKVSPYGVTRQKKAPMKASSKASVFEGRSSRGADPRMFRSQVVGKAAPLTLKPKEQKQLAGTKRKSANLSTLGGAISLTGLGLLAARKKSAATTLGIIGGGVGGTNSLIGASVQRREAKALDAGVKKDYVMPYFTPRQSEKLPLNVVVKAAWGAQVPLGAAKTLTMRPSTIATRRAPGGILKTTRVKASIG